MIDIVMPTFMPIGPALTIRAVESLAAAHNRTPWRLIWVDDGSPPDALHEAFRAVGQHCTIPIFESINRGFAAAVNLGLDMSRSTHTSSDVVIINNDIQTPDGWLDELVGSMRSNPSIGVAGAITDNISGATQASRFSRKDRERAFIQARTGSNVAFFCTVIRRQCLLEVGPLCEEFRNGGEDDDFNDRARAAGWLVGVCPRCYVLHDHHGTFAHLPDHAQDTVRNRELLARRRQERKPL